MPEPTPQPDAAFNTRRDPGVLRRVLQVWMVSLLDNLDMPERFGNLQNTPTIE